ncbi:hypothetical protein HRG_000564 [Hirsutella rhossiliensis]|uniref:Uncharacterized protein n=1 Tax=Hirsutella rhossiliensis TaxID=111463 RepID=A0A9P8N6L0_9HYPO|nr:uncharacterized protein HRG_00564 [Hirsutella rhossiliensis]KAH0967922.1 hypothetical protein HRG_00564 [Hirsutella rhossiliensis]
MSDQISEEARRAVNEALATAGSAAVRQLVDTAHSSKSRRKANKSKKMEEEGVKKEEVGESKVRTRGNSQR